MAVMTVFATSAPPEPMTSPAHPGPRAALAASVLGFFVVTLDATVVNVALPSIRADLGGALTGLQWVVDGYTLMFAALLLTAGALTDRWGARTALGIGLAVFVLASVACAMAPTVAVLVAARFVQGAGAAVTMPASMALVRHSYDEPARRARAIGIWSMGAAVAAASGPVIGGLLSLTSWRLIFVLNVPVGIVTLLLLARAPESSHHARPLDWSGQILAILALTGLTYGAIEAGALGLTAPRVLTAVAVSLAAAVAFVVRQGRASHPMLPLELFTSRTVNITVAVGFAFMVCFYGLPFLYSLQLQQVRGLSSLGAGLVFLPMLALSGALTPLSAPVVERVGARATIVTGLTLMAVGAIALTLVPASAPVWVTAALLLPVGLAGPLVMPPTTALLLDAVPAHRAGTASAVFNTGRQIGGALAVAVFGALLASSAGFVHGLHLSLIIAGLVAAAVAFTAARLETAPHSEQERS
jgi:DHA2 family methylenomycin A resistance protein-like MFS transporter